MKVTDHRIEPIWYRETSNLSAGKVLDPTIIVMHYTTGWSGTGSRDWLMGAAGGTSNRGSSAHVVVDRDGTAWQIAPFNRVAWHAGPSRYGALKGLNNHAVGIEFVNPGPLSPDGSGRYADGYGNRRTEGDLDEFGGYVSAPHSRVGSQVYAWPLYTEAQLATGRSIVEALTAGYDIRAIVSHEEIDTRGWKTDPGPAFPMESFRALLGEDHDDVPLMKVTATRLNIRGGPGTQYEKLDPPGSIASADVVEVLSSEGVWRYVEVKSGGGAGTRGWVHGAYLG